MFAAHAWKAQQAVAVLDQAAFEREAALLESLMEYIEVLLSHDDYYWLSPSIRKARQLPGAPADVDLRARDIYTLWADVIRDYAARDFYELVQGYYRPRVTAWIRALRDALSLDQRMIVDTAQLDRQYDLIERKWVSESFPLIDRRPVPIQVIKTIQTMLARLSLRRRSDEEGS